MERWCCSEAWKDRCCILKQIPFQGACPVKLNMFECWTTTFMDHRWSSAENRFICNSFIIVVKMTEVNPEEVINSISVQFSDESWACVLWADSVIFLLYKMLTPVSWKHPEVLIYSGRMYSWHTVGAQGSWSFQVYLCTRFLVHNRGSVLLNW